MIMIQEDGSMTEWVTGVKAAKMTGLDHSNVYRNAMAGRLVFRVREGHVYYPIVQVAQFEGGPMGQPSHHGSDGSFSKAERDALRELRRDLEAKYEDVIYKPVFDAGQMYIDVSAFRNGNWTRLPRRKLTKK